MSKENNKDIKTFNVRLPKELWLFLKQEAMNQEVSMADIIVRCISKYKKKFDNKLT